MGEPETVIDPLIEVVAELAVKLPPESVNVFSVSSWLPVSKVPSAWMKEVATSRLRSSVIVPV